MPFDPLQSPKRPRHRSNIFLWPGIAYFVIAVLIGAIVARVTDLLGYGHF